MSTTTPTESTTTASGPRAPSAAASLAGLAVALAACSSAALLGARFRPDGWYADLAKPTFQPPASLFGPVWTVLYALMAVAAWRVWRKGGRGARGALRLFALQLALNAAWSPLFFGAHAIGLALADLVLLVLAVAATLLAFARVDRAAAALLVPYLAWVSFAAVLNASILALNR